MDILLLVLSFFGGWAISFIFLKRKIQGATKQHAFGVLVGAALVFAQITMLPLVKNKNLQTAEQPSFPASPDQQHVQIHAAITTTNPLGLAQPTIEHQTMVAATLQSPEAAYKLSSELSKCADLDRLIEEHKHLKDRLNSVQLEAATQQLESLTETCEPLLGMNSKTGYELARHAAMAGYLRAQIDFPGLAAPYITGSEENSLNEELIKQFKEDSVRFAKAAASTGSAEALLHAHFVFSDGILTAPDKNLSRTYLAEYLRVRPNIQLQQRLDSL